MGGVAAVVAVGVLLGVLVLPDVLGSSATPADGEASLEQQAASGADADSSGSGQANNDASSESPKGDGAEADGAAANAAPVDVSQLSVRASSVLPTEGVNSKSYAAANVLDGSSSSCWCPKSGDATGESVVFTAASPRVFSGFTIRAGYQESEYLYSVNARPSSIVVYAEGVAVGSFVLEDAGLAAQSFEFTQPVTSTELEFVIGGTYAGEKYQDCCISEISFW